MLCVQGVAHNVYGENTVTIHHSFTMKKSFSAVSEKGNAKIHEPDSFKKFLEKIGDDERIVVTIEKWYKKYSDKQRNYYFGVPVSILAEHTGFSPKEMHEALKMKFLTQKGEVIDKVQSITSLSTVQMEEYLKHIRDWAADSLDCYVPEPNEAPLEYRYNLNNLHDDKRITGFIL